MKNYRAWRFIAVAACASLLSTCAAPTEVDNRAGQISEGEQPQQLVTITSDEIGTLPEWQQELLSDPGWQQPPLPPQFETPLPSPNPDQDFAELRRETSRAIYAGRRAGDKTGSWTGGKQPQCDIQQGEYGGPFGGGECPPSQQFAETVCYECQGDVTFDKKIEDVLRPEDLPFLITYVEKGVSASNHFNTTGGSTNNALSSIYQICSGMCPIDPGDPYSYYPPGSTPKFAEISYRADNGPNATDDPCSGQLAYLVGDFIWWKYNQQNFKALPGGNSTPLYNILIAPSSERSEPATSSAGTSATYQSFYMGNLNMAIYGGSQIVSLESSTSACEVFSDSIAGNRLFYTNPIYGVLLKRWQDAVIESMEEPYNNPWDTDFGWPVQGPLAYQNGASQLTPRGAYYVWGMYFEHGFMWWVDYVNNTNVPDEAQAYLFTGDNVFCRQPGDRYEKLPTIFYGGTGPLGVSVVVEASLNDGSNGDPPGRYYEVANPPGGPTVLLDMHAHGYGGAARESDGRYQHYTWAFRDGTTLTNEDPFNDVTKYVQHAYSTAAVYTVRVQVIDSNGQIGYGDSLPIYVSDGS